MPHSPPATLLNQHVQTLPARHKSLGTVLKVAARHFWPWGSQRHASPLPAMETWSHQRMLLIECQPPRGGWEPSQAPRGLAAEDSWRPHVTGFCNFLPAEASKALLNWPRAHMYSVAPGSLAPTKCGFPMGSRIVSAEYDCCWDLRACKQGKEMYGKHVASFSGAEQVQVAKHPQPSSRQARQLSLNLSVTTADSHVRPILATAINVLQSQLPDSAKHTVGTCQGCTRDMAPQADLKDAAAACF